MICQKKALFGRGLTHKRSHKTVQAHSRILSQNMANLPGRVYVTPNLPAEEFDGSFRSLSNPCRRRWVTFCDVTWRDRWRERRSGRERMSKRERGERDTNKQKEREGPTTETDRRTSPRGAGAIPGRSSRGGEPGGPSPCDTAAQECK